MLRCVSKYAYITFWLQVNCVWCPPVSVTARVAAYCLDYYEESSQLDDLSVGSAIDIPGRNGKEKVQDPEAAIRVLVRVRLMAVLPIWAKRLLVWAGLAG